jgi:hypothetical protein
MPAPLDYAPPIPWHRRRRLHRWLIGAALLVTLLSSAKWAPPAWRHAQLLYWQRQCMNYTAPADTVVAVRGKSIPDRDQAPIPDAWANFADLSPSRPLLGDVIYASVFLHSRTSAGGHTRLVHVAISRPLYFTMGSLGRVYLECHSVQPASLLGPPRLIHRSGYWFNRYNDQIQILAGQPNPDDLAHFTIAYEIDGKPGIIDGWLMEDDTVKLEPRK